MSYFVYILKNLQSDFYVGQTNNLDKRVQEHLHKTTKAAKFTKEHSSFNLVYNEEYLKREKQLKGWSHAKKEALIKGDLTTLKELSKSKST